MWRGKNVSGTYSGQAQGAGFAPLNRPLAGQTISGRAFFFFRPFFFFKFSYLSVGESVESEQLILSKCRERNVRDLTSDCVVCMRV